jgi:hypothetical protein
MTPSLAHRAYVKYFLIGSLALVCTAGITGGTRAYIANLYQESLVDQRTIFGIRPFAEYIVIESVSASSHTLIAQTWSRALNGYVRTRLSYDEALIVEREDAIIEGNVIVGIKPTEKARIADLTPGMRAIALVNISESGSLFVHYILIGNPFPRP